MNQNSSQILTASFVSLRRVYSSALAILTVTSLSLKIVGQLYKVNDMEYSLVDALLW